MKLTRSPEGYVVQVPDDVVAALGLHEGDFVQLEKASIDRLDVSDAQREQAMQTIRDIARQNPMPPGFIFDREEANAR